MSSAFILYLFTNSYYHILYLFYTVLAIYKICTYIEPYVVYPYNKGKQLFIQKIFQPIKYNYEKCKRFNEATKFHSIKYSYDLQMKKFIKFVEQSQDKEMAGGQELLSWNPTMQLVIEDHNQRYKKMFDHLYAKYKCDECGNHFREHFPRNFKPDINQEDKLLLAKSAEKEYVKNAQALGKAIMIALSAPSLLPIKLLQIISEYINAQALEKATMIALSAPNLLPIKLSQIISEYVIGDEANVKYLGEKVCDFYLELVPYYPDYN